MNLNQSDYDALFQEEKKTRKERSLLKRQLIVESYKSRPNMEEKLLELQLRDVRRERHREGNHQRLKEIKERMIELQTKEMEHKRERQKQKIAENKCQESFFIPKYEHVTIGAEPLSIDGFLKLHFVYDATYCLIESDKEILPKKYISSIFFKVDEKNHDNYTVTAKIIFKEKTIHVNFASVGTKNSAYFLMQKLIKFYLFQGFNVKNASGITIIEEEH